MKALKLILVILLLLPGAAPGGEERPAPELLVLEIHDEAGDQEFPVSIPSAYPGGDLLGARLVLEKVPVKRDPRIAGYYTACVYVPLRLELDIREGLHGGEVQRNIFISIPPLHIEHVAVRNSLPVPGPSGEEEQLLLEGQMECGFLTGMEERLDLLIETLRETPTYRNLAFDAPLADRHRNFQEASELSISRGTVFYFPRTPAFHWREVPPVTIASSLAVCELEAGRALGIKMLVADELRGSWSEATDRPPAGDQ